MFGWIGPTTRQPHRVRRSHTITIRRQFAIASTGGRAETVVSMETQNVESPCDALKAESIKARLLDVSLSANQRKKYRKKLSRLFHTVGSSMRLASDAATCTCALTKSGW